MKLLPLFLLGTILIFSACNNKNEKTNLIEDVSITSLRKSNEAISQLSDANYRSLSEKLTNVIYGPRVGLWNDKALKLKAITRKVIQQISSLNGENKFSTKDIFSLKSNYTNEVKLIDSSLKRFETDFNFFLNNNDSVFSAAFIVEKTKNDLLLLESKFSSYFNSQVGAFIDDYTTFSSLVGQNTNHLKTGDTLEISAGVGSFTLAAKPSFTIDGNIIEPDGNARATYRLKVTGKGKKTIPVNISFTNTKGIKESQNLSLNYYVD